MDIDIEKNARKRVVENVSHHLALPISVMQ